MFEVKLFQSAHCVGEANLHLQFTPKYRNDIFEDEAVRKGCEEELKEVAKRLKVSLAGLGFGPDHVHLFVTNWKNYSIAELAQYFKGATSRMLRKKYWPRISLKLWGHALWTGGYFYRTVGAVTAPSMHKYVTESQQKHWIAQKQSVNPQTTLLQF